MIGAFDDRKLPFIWLNLELDDLDLTPHAFRLYVHIVRRAGKDGMCWESVNNMATHCKMSTGKVKESLKQLCDRTMITRQSRPGYTSIYRVENVDLWASEGGGQNMATLPSQNMATPQPEYGQGVASMDPGGGQNMATKKDHFKQIPSNRSIEESGSQNEIDFSYFVRNEFLDLTALGMYSFPWGTVDHPNAQLIEHLITVYLPTVEPYSKQPSISPYDAKKYVKGMKNKADLFKSELRFDTIQSEWQKSVELKTQAEQRELVRQQSLATALVESAPASSTEVPGIDEIKNGLRALSQSKGFTRLNLAVVKCPTVDLGDRSIGDLNDLEWKAVHDWLGTLPVPATAAA